MREQGSPRGTMKNSLPLDLSIYPIGTEKKSANRRTNSFSPRGQESDGVEHKFWPKAKRDQRRITFNGPHNAREREPDRFRKRVEWGAVFINVRERGHVSGLRSAIKMFL